MAHSGTNVVLATMRQKYWITRKKVERCVKKCQICKRYWIKPYAQPQFPTLPIERVNPFRPFMHSAVDYFGHVTIKTTNGDHQKRWVAVYTCTSTRAVHLEVAEDLSAQAFLHTFRRFIAQHKKPKLMISDNGTNFKAAEKVLTSIWKENQIQKYASDHEINWIFVTERAPWKNGLVERMVGLIKYSLKRTIGKKLLFEDEFRTLINEIQTIVNSRPLNFLPDSEHVRSLRPLDFLIPYEEGNADFPHLPKVDVEDPDYLPEKMKNKDKLVEELKLASNRLDLFWKIWSNEYLLALRERKNFVKNDKTAENSPQLGDVVIIRDDDIKNRGIWKLGIIEKLLPGGRTAVLKTKNGETRRAVNDLFGFEINGQEKLIPEMNEQIVENKSKNKNLKINNKINTCLCNIIICRPMEEGKSEASLDYDEQHENLINKNDVVEEPPNKVVKHDERNLNDRLKSFVSKVQKEKLPQKEVIKEAIPNQAVVCTSRLEKLLPKPPSENKIKEKTDQQSVKDNNIKEENEGYALLHYGWSVMYGCSPGTQRHKNCSSIKLGNIIDLARKEEIKEDYSALLNKTVESLIQVILCFWALTKIRKDWWKNKNEKTISVEAGMELVDQILKAQRPAHIIRIIENNSNKIYPKGKLDEDFRPRKIKPALSLWKAACEMAEESFDTRPWLPVHLRGQNKNE
uniref:Integrase catalytic domain-containing protein n=1 Tax=Meloidogyne enterolobii TaxID=390850 RepID=A0A6V7XSW6_MELEN|nr:unnamed protein product [Meloidogyne enterolobii]